MKRTQTEMLTDFMAGVSTMIDASSQMTHSRMNPKWMGIRDMLNIIKDDTIKLVKAGGR